MKSEYTLKNSDIVDNNMRLYFYVADKMIKDPRWKRLPNYCQNSSITTVFIACKEQVERRKEYGNTRSVSEV